TRQVEAVAADPGNAKARFWNPAGASLEQALIDLNVPDARIGVVGGSEVFALFLDRYDAFYLSRAPHVRLPGGRPVFPEGPTQTPEQVLAAHGMRCAERRALDPSKGLALETWERDRV
ncbi:MAG TPA: hypothetical protein VKQ70_16830, partial [Caulobacteraceae bacterium]|nr:hypothetical protein [Caulobacteraceae bacterium]